MKIEPGLIVVIVAIGVFYLRLIQLRGRRKKERQQEQLERVKAQKKRKSNDPPPPALQERPMFQIGSWWLLGGGAILMLAGLGLRTSPGILPVMEPYWWIFTAVGVLVFTFGLK
jgi:hypothetical protein